MHMDNGAPYPKIELHVHLEATVKPERLLEIARRNGERLPADTVEGIRERYRVSDFDEFIKVWPARWPAPLPSGERSDHWTPSASAMASGRWGTRS